MCSCQLTYPYNAILEPIRASPDPIPNLIQCFGILERVRRSASRMYSLDISARLSSSDDDVLHLPSLHPSLYLAV